MRRVAPVKRAIVQARLAPYVFAGQLMGLHTGLKKGLDPDNPRNLTRVVVLDEEKSEKTHAAL